MKAREDDDIDRVQLLSVNVGELQVIPWAKKKAKTGIFKRPADGQVGVDTLGLEGDHIGSVKYHGGPDQAVYIYSAQDYDWWKNELQRDLPFGTFGENLTVSTFGEERPVRLGDVWEIGDVTLEISAPRIPCATLAARMDDPTFVRRFAQANRGGAYARVLQVGVVEAGTTVRITPCSAGHPTVDEVFAVWHQKKKDPVFLQRVLASPLASMHRKDVEKWLARLS